MFSRLTELKWKGIKSRETWSHFASYALLIGPTTFVTSVMGFLSFKLKSSKFVFWKIHFVYATILTALYTAAMIITAYVYNSSLRFKDISELVHSNFIIFLSLIIFIAAYANNRSMTKAIQRVSETSLVIPPNIFCKLTKIIFMKDLMLFIPLLSFIPTILRLDNQHFHFLMWYTFVGVVTLNNLYTNNVYVLSACFQQINESLEKVKEILINEEPHLRRRVIHARKNPVLLTMLRRQKKQHLETSKSVHELNNAFSTQMEASLFLFLCHITFNLYTNLVVYNGGGRIKVFSYHINFAFFYIIHVVVIIMFVDITRSEIEKIGWNLHRILIHTSDEKMATELEMFSLQVLQRGNTFTMKGIVLDFTYFTQQINESLEKVKEILINDEPHLLRRVFHAQKNPMLLSILRRQKEQHLEASKTVHELNSAFGTQIEATLFLLFTDITFNIYAFLLMYNEEYKIIKYNFYVTFAIVFAIFVVVIIVIVDITRSEMEQIGWNIHRILTHTSDEKVTTEVSFYHFLFWYTFLGVVALSNLYTNNVYVLYTCFQQINESLEKVKEILINDDPHLLRRVFHARKNPVLLSMLRRQKEQHLETSKAVHELNDAFSMQMEALLYLLFIDITFNIYTYLVVYNEGGKIKVFSSHIYFAVFYVVHVIVIILIVDITRSEMEKIGWNIHRILIHTSDEKMTTELEMFSLQVLQRGNRFTMKAIVLHFTYLRQIVCGITTFLLILVQFLIDRPC
ncbi:hypothetical protein WN48_08212 [Eufriesea mexicana]|nr:hypothetical protein WN48_08212 [Eufriesea mexicana]